MSTDPMQNPDPLLNQESLAAAEGMAVPNRAGAGEPSAEAEVAQASPTDPPAAGAGRAEASTADATTEATTAEAVATSADAATTGDATTAQATTAEATTAEAVATSADASTTADATTAEATTADATTAQAIAAGAAAAGATTNDATAVAGTAVPGTAVAGVPAEGSVDAAIAANAPVVVAKPVTRWRGRVIIGLRRLVRFAFAAALFGLGVLAGLDVFRTSQPVTGPVGDPAVNGVPAPALVAELANAIAADDADAIRAALQPQTFSRYTAEMERFGITTVQSVETLGTYNDDGRTATALIILGRTTDQSPFSINLIVLTENGQIVSFR